VPHPLRRCLREYLCRRLLGRLSHSAFSMMDVTDVSARAGIVSASGSTIAAVSTITGVGRVARSVSRADDLGFVVPATEISTKLPVGEEVVACATGVLHLLRWVLVYVGRQPLAARRNAHIHWR